MTCLLKSQFYDEDIAKRVIKLALESLYIFQNIVEIDCIKNLKDPLYDLLLIFNQKGLQDYYQFIKNHPDIFKSFGYPLLILGLSQKDLEHKMRLLELISISRDNYGKVLDYSLISKALNASLETVEIFIVDAIRLGLLDAKLDQNTQTVEIM